MAKSLLITNAAKKGGLPVANQGMKLSKLIPIANIEEHPEFKKLYPIDEHVLSRITESMRIIGYDPTQPVHIWKQTDEDGTEHMYLIDGYTRKTAAIACGFETIPYSDHDFKSFEEAHRYALHLQVDRRNLEGIDLLRNIETLMGSEYIKSIEGNKNAIIGEMLGVSEKTVERDKYVLENATEGQMAQIEAGEATPNKIRKDLKYIEKNATEEQKERFASGEASPEEIIGEIVAEKNKEAKKNRHVSVKEDDTADGDFSVDEDDISDALEDNSDEPQGLSTWNHHHERPHFNPAGEVEASVAEKRESFLLGKADGFKLGLRFALAEVLLGKNAEEILSDINSRELSSVVMDNLKLTEEQEEALTAFEPEEPADGAEISESFDII